MKRYKYLDGHRGLAILLVFFYHAYARWTELVPYGSSFYDIVIFKYGYLGVQLFFIISGFVILMSLENSRAPLVFLKRRWLRIFPGMFICSMFIFFTSSYFPYRPSGVPDLGSLLPGLTLIDFNLWQAILGYPDKQLEGVFWSIYVEVKFYIFAVIIYFNFGRTVLVWSLISAFFLACFTRLLTIVFDSMVFVHLDEIIKLFSFRHFGWFAIGACYYIFTQTKSYKWFYSAIAISVFCSMVPTNMTWQSAIGSLFVCLFFGASVVNYRLQSLLANKILIFFGFISYPLYLIHENALISIVIQLDLISEFVGYVYFPVIALFILSVPSFYFSKYFEPRFKSILEKLLFSKF